MRALQRCNPGPPAEPGVSAAADQGWASVTALFQAHGRLVFARCRRILNDAAQAEDAAQETFLRAQASLRDGVAPEDPAAWLQALARNYCISQLRSRALRQTRAAGEPRPTPAQHPEDRALVVKLMASLDEAVALTAWMCHVEGMTHDEVGRALSVSRRTVWNRLRRFAETGQRLVNHS